MLLKTSVKNKTNRFQHVKNAKNAMIHGYRNDLISKRLIVDVYGSFENSLCARSFLLP